MQLLDRCQYKVLRQPFSEPTSTKAEVTQVALFSLEASAEFKLLKRRNHQCSYASSKPAGWRAESHDGVACYHDGYKKRQERRHCYLLVADRYYCKCFLAKIRLGFLLISNQFQIPIQLPLLK